MRSFELKVSAPRGREDAAGEQTGRERPEGERDRDALGDRGVKWDAHWGWPRSLKGLLLHGGPD